MNFKNRPSTAAVSRPPIVHDYSKILKSILLPEYLPAGLAWLKVISKEGQTKSNSHSQIQGLRIIGAVVKHRGTKKFKKRVKKAKVDVSNPFMISNSFKNLTKKQIEVLK